MRFFPELLTLVRGMARAMQPLGPAEREFREQRSGVEFHRGQRVSLSLEGGFFKINVSGLCPGRASINPAKTGLNRLKHPFSSRSVAWVLLFLLIVTYIFAPWTQVVAS